MSSWIPATGGSTAPSTADDYNSNVGNGTNGLGDTYVGRLCMLRKGTATQEIRIITAASYASNVVTLTVNEAWDTAPANGDAFDVCYEPGDIEEAIGIMHESLGDDAEDLVVQAMTSPGVDVRIRCEHDDRLGTIVSVGLGGAQADAIDDRTSRLAPVSPASAAAMLAETRLTAALDGADRGHDLGLADRAYPWQS